jgi:KUP system potassium uptake protein
MVIRYGYAEQVLSKELGQFVYTELQKYIVTELLPDGRSSAIVNPRGAKLVTETIAKRLKDRGKKDGVSSYLDKPAELKSSTITSSANDGDSFEKPGDSEVSSKLNSPIASSSIERPDHSPKPPVVDINERERRLKTLEAAYKQQVLYIVGKTELRVPDKGENIFRRVFLSVFLFLRDLTNEKSTSLRIPMDKLVEVGFIRDL